MQSRWKNTRGNSIIIGTVAAALIGITVVMLTNGYLSTLKYKARTEQKAALTPVLDSILSSLAQATFYSSPANPSDTLSQKMFMDRLLGPDGLDVPGGGKLVPFDANSAALLDVEDPDSIALCNNSTKTPLIPAAKTSEAVFVFCVSLRNSSSAPSNTFFGSDAGFALFKVVLKKADATHKDYLTVVPTWGSFIDSTQQIKEFQAEFTYSIFWGKKHDVSNTFKKFGVAVKDLS